MEATLFILVVVVWWIWARGKAKAAEERERLRVFIWGQNWGDRNLWWLVHLDAMLAEVRLPGSDVKGPPDALYLIRRASPTQWEYRLRDEDHRARRDALRDDPDRRDSYDTLGSSPRWQKVPDEMTWEIEPQYQEYLHQR